MFDGLLLIGLFVGGIWLFKRGFDKSTARIDNAIIAKSAVATIATVATVATVATDEYPGEFLDKYGSMGLSLEEQFYNPINNSGDMAIQDSGSTDITSMD